jgi:hypothetical protein
VASGVPAMWSLARSGREHARRDSCDRSRHFGRVIATPNQRLHAFERRLERTGNTAVTTD